MEFEKVIEDTNFTDVGESTLDDRKRVALTKALEVIRDLLGDASLERLRFRVACNSIGQILLSPETSIPAHEAWLYRNKAALASVQRGLEQAGEGRVKSLGSFAKYADADID